MIAIETILIKSFDQLINLNLVKFGFTSWAFYKQPSSNQNW